MNQKAVALGSPIHLTTSLKVRMIIWGLLSLLLGCRSTFRSLTSAPGACQGLPAQRSVFEQLDAWGYAKKYRIPRRLDAYATKDGQGLYYAYLYARSKTHGVNVPCLMTRSRFLLNPALADGFSEKDTVGLTVRLQQALTELSPTFTTGALDTIREDFLRGGYAQTNEQYVHFR